MLVWAGFVVVLVLVNVSGFRPVLARGWHGSAPLPDCQAAKASGRKQPVMARVTSLQQAVLGIITAVHRDAARRVR